MIKIKVNDKEYYFKDLFELIRWLYGNYRKLEIEYPIGEDDNMEFVRKSPHEVEKWK